MKSLRPHIGLFGKRNAGKSSLINALANQEIAIVSDQPGTTTDPVNKTIELGELGPVVLVDTAGFDDKGYLGEKRVSATKEVLNHIDLALILFTGDEISSYEETILKELQDRQTPYLLIHHKSDLYQLPLNVKQDYQEKWRCEVIEFSSLQIEKIPSLISKIRAVLPETAFQTTTLFGDLVKKGDLVLLITPIDSEAPQGRMILPQVQALRDALDHNCIVIILKESELQHFWDHYHLRPQLVVTDSQCFAQVAKLTPPDIKLTSFSILMSRLKADYPRMVEGTSSIDQLKSGDRILILESCSHHVTADDIGRVKIPRWLTNYTGHPLEFDIVAGLQKAPRQLKDYQLIIQCGGCMLTRKQVLMRLHPAIQLGIPVTNYGMVIAHCQGILHRVLLP